MVVSRNLFKIRLLLNNYGAVLPKIQVFTTMIHSFQVNIICMHLCAILCRTNCLNTFHFNSVYVTYVREYIFFKYGVVITPSQMFINRLKFSLKSNEEYLTTFDCCSCICVFNLYACFVPSICHHTLYCMYPHGPYSLLEFANKLTYLLIIGHRIWL